MARRPRPEPFTPARFVRDGLDPSGRTRPAGFAALGMLVLALYALWRLGPLHVAEWTRGHEALAAIPLAVLLVPALGHALRRLNDMGQPGWWAWALAVPWLRWAMLGALLLLPSSQRRGRTDSRWRLGGLAVAGGAAVVLAGSLIWTAAVVADQGMKPSLLPGDLVLLRRAPIEARRGDVVAVRVPGRAAPRLGRVVALGGERVAVDGGRPVIGGVRATQAPDGVFVEVFGREGPQGTMPVCGNGAVGLGAECRTRRLEETLPGGAAYSVLDAGPRPLDAMGEVVVPEGFLFVLGDHRDAAQDSRLVAAVGGLGLVPVERVMGRAEIVLGSSRAARGWDPRGWRPGRAGTLVR